MGGRCDAAPSPALLYDASRLCTRVLNPTPNGIDRLDALLARGLLGAGETGAAAPLVFGWGGPRLLPAARVATALGRVERAWREGDDGTEDDAAVAAVAEALADAPASRLRPARGNRAGVALARRLGAGLGTLGTLGLRGGADPARAAARHAIYLNASHFPLDWPSHVAWLARRPDVRPVVLVHDLLPVDHPEWFWAGEAGRHRARLTFLAARGAGAIVTSRSVEHRLRAEMARAGRPDLPILCAKPPIAPAFRVPPEPDRRLADARYFVVCGTVEPRKNHALLLRVWRRLAAGGGPMPRLVVVGKRGWSCDGILREMQALAQEGSLVLAHDLPSGAYRRLLDGCLALLAPSLAEGYGLPVAEARARGVPVIASDIAPFREQGGAVLLDPHDDAAWAEAVAAAGSAPWMRRGAALPNACEETRYLAEVRTFLAALA